MHPYSDTFSVACDVSAQEDPGKERGRVDTCCVLLSTNKRSGKTLFGNETRGPCNGRYYLIYLSSTISTGKSLWCLQTLLTDIIKSSEQYIEKTSHET